MSAANGIGHLNAGQYLYRCNVTSPEVPTVFDIFGVNGNCGEGYLFAIGGKSLIPGLLQSATGVLTRSLHPELRPPPAGGRSRVLPEDDCAGILFAGSADNREGPGWGLHVILDRAEIAYAPGESRDVRLILRREYPEYQIISNLDDFVSQLSPGGREIAENVPQALEAGFHDNAGADSGDVSQNQLGDDPPRTGSGARIQIYESPHQRLSVPRGRVIGRLCRVVRGLRRIRVYQAGGDMDRVVREVNGDESRLRFVAGVVASDSPLISSGPLDGTG